MRITGFAVIWVIFGQILGFPCINLTIIIFIHISTADVLESFATHPPLLLPTTNFVLDLTKAPTDKSFFKYRDKMNSLFGGNVGKC